MKFNGIFIKFGDFAHIETLQKQGLVFCNTLDYFIKNTDEVQGDKLEGAYKIDYSKKSIIHLNSINRQNHFNISIKITKLVKRINNPTENLFCLYSLNMLKMRNNEKWFIPKKLLKKYESFLIIKDVDIFLSRLQSELKKRQFKWEHHLVDYKDFSNKVSTKNIFQKDMQYDYQKEFRLFIENNNHEIIKLYIGDISDISCIYKTINSEEKYFIRKDLSK